MGLFKRETNKFISFILKASHLEPNFLPCPRLAAWTTMPSPGEQGGNEAGAQARCLRLRVLNSCQGHFSMNQCSWECGCNLLFD